MRIHKEAGVAHILLVIIFVLVIAAVGLVGYGVWQKSKDKQSTTTNTTASTSETWKKGGAAVPGTYADADVVQVSDNMWRLYYAIQPEVQGNQFEVYSATSTDGKTWTQESGMRKTFATFPEVVKLSNGKYRMYFQNAGEIKSAISDDGLTFTDESGTRMSATTEDGLALDNAAAPAVLQLDDDTYVMVYRATLNEQYGTLKTPNATTNFLMWATSNDGLTFTRKGIAVDSRNDTLYGQLDGPDLVKYDDGKYRLFATSYTGVYSFTFDGTTFGDPVLAFAGDAQKVGNNFNGAPPGDPSVAEINGTWYMYYGIAGTSGGIYYANRN